MFYQTIAELYFDTKEHLSKEFGANVYEVEYSSYKVDKSLLLSQLGIGHRSIINFVPSDSDELVTNYGESDDVKGWVTYFTQNDNSHHAAVFIISDFEFEHSGDELDEDSMLEHKYLYKYLSLLHEFGHVKDFIEQNNIHHTDDVFTINLVHAEAFADNFALRKMKNSPEPYIKLARKMMANAVIKRRKIDDFYNQVYQATINLFPKSKLTKWAEI